jgi:hypothetical protein
VALVLVAVIGRSHTEKRNRAPLARPQATIVLFPRSPTPSGEARKAA